MFHGTDPVIAETETGRDKETQRTSTDVALGELIDRCNRRHHAAADSTVDVSECFVTQCSLQFEELLNFTDGSNRLAPADGRAHAEAVDMTDQHSSTRDATWFVGELKARQYFTTLTARQSLLVCLSAIPPAPDTNQDELTPGATLCARLIQEILAIGRMPSSSKVDRQTLRESMETAFSDLLDLLDVLTLIDGSKVLQFAENYAENGRAWRARGLIRQHLRKSPDDTPARLMLGRLLFAEKRHKDAAHCFAGVIERQPELWQAHRQMGLCQLRALRFDESIISLRTAQALRDRSDDRNIADEELAVELQRATRLRAAMSDAGKDACMPAVVLESAELEQGFFHPETLSVAAALYRRHGTLCLQNAFDPAVISACREQFMSDYRQYFTDRPHKDALQIGDRRFQVSIALHGHFNQPAFYANPFVIALMKKLINSQVIIGSTVCATSLPGSKDQHLHKDHRALFTEGVDDEPVAMPPVAITTMIPLVALNEQIGTTLVKKGSHRKSRKSSATMAYQTPVVGEGGCFFMDLALSHKGQGNRTDRVRPIINMVYSQHWFADNKNFKLQPPLQISPDEFQRIPEKHRSLVNWAIQPGPQVNR